MLDKLKGYRTYLTLGVVVILGAIDAYNGHCVATQTCKAFQIPGLVFTALGFLGIYTRSQVGK